jgi:hypothetical protein
MSYKNSNLYASRVYAEHPIAMWSMDEEYFFFSLISDNQKFLSASVGNWVLTNATSEIATDILTSPIPDDPTTKIYLSSASSRYMEMQLSSPISYEDSINIEKGSISISTHVNIPTDTNIVKVRIGFIINSQEYYKDFFNFIDNFWEYLSFTKQIDSQENITPYIKVFYTDDESFGELESSIYFNGISVGQWSEPYSFNNTGIISESLPGNITSIIDYPELLKGSEIDQYGVTGNLGYAIEYDKKLLIENTGIPMVYGSKGNVSILNKKIIENFDSEISSFGAADETVTLLVDGGIPSSTYTEFLNGGIPEYIDPVVPSLIFPGYGFLNSSGIYHNLTAEFWIRISHQSNQDIKIFGPIKSNDGLYVSGEFITLKVGKYSQSYFINQWYRPMLLHISQSETEFFVMINGEKVISMDVDFSKIDTFPSSSEDYLGFYGNEKISLFEMDCFSIFPYTISEQVAKKRYVFGQGVQEQENIVVPYGGQLSYVDFPYSGYGSTIKYPDRTSWTDGYYNNIVANLEGISLPSYSLPEIIFTSSNNIVFSETVQNEKKELLEKDNYTIQDEPYPFISINPNNSYESVYPVINFSTLNQSTYETKSIHSIFSTSSDIETEQSLLYIYNSSNTDYFQVLINSGSLQYIFNNNIISSASVSTNQYLAAGLDFDKISENYSSIIGTFFSNPETLSLELACHETNKFLGKIFSLTFNNDFFTEKDNSLIFGPSNLSNGIALKEFDDSLYNYVGTYTLLPKKSNSTVFFDIGCSGYWENSVPLSYFGKYINTSNEGILYDLDILQFNVDIPSSIFSKESTEASAYQSGLLSKVYVSLHKNVDLPKVYSEYSNTENIGLERVLDFNSIENFESTKFEICDGTIIYPPKSGIGFANYSLVTYIILTSRGTNTEKMKVKDMSISSLTFDESEFYSINTPAVGKFYPVTKSQDQYIYKKQIPVTINNESSPYLYLSGDSGISVLPKSEGELLKGLSIPINESLKPVDNIVGLQMFLMVNESSEFSENKVIGKIFSNLVSYDIVLIPELDQKRAQIRVQRSDNKAEVPYLRFFLNGREVNTIFIKPLDWNFITISFQESSINLNGKIGQFEIYSGVRVDNVSIFSEISTTKNIQFNYDSWSQAFDGVFEGLELEDGNESWGFWSASVSAAPNTWEVPLNQKETSIQILSIDGNSVFNTYSGLSSFVGDDNSILGVNFDSVNVLNDTEWDTFEIKPV